MAVWSKAQQGRQAPRQARTRKSLTIEVLTMCLEERPSERGLLFTDFCSRLKTVSAGASEAGRGESGSATREGQFMAGRLRARQVRATAAC